MQWLQTQDDWEAEWLQQPRSSHGACLVTVEKKAHRRAPDSSEKKHLPPSTVPLSSTHYPSLVAPRPTRCGRRQPELSLNSPNRRDAHPKGQEHFSTFHEANPVIRHLLLARFNPDVSDLGHENPGDTQFTQHLAKPETGRGSARLQVDEDGVCATKNVIAMTVALRSAVNTWSRGLPPSDNAKRSPPGKW